MMSSPVLRFDRSVHDEDWKICFKKVLGEHKVMEDDVLLRFMEINKSAVVNDIQQIVTPYFLRGSKFRAVLVEKKLCGCGGAQNPDFTIKVFERRKNESNEE